MTKFICIYKELKLNVRKKINTQVELVQELKKIKVWNGKQNWWCLYANILSILRAIISARHRVSSISISRRGRYTCKSAHAFIVNFFIRYCFFIFTNTGRAWWMGYGKCFFRLFKLTLWWTPSQKKSVEIRDPLTVPSV